jgi:hypothetical protein
VEHDDTGNDFNWQGHLRVLTYDLIFERDPMSRVDDAVRTVVNDPKRAPKSADFVKAIRLGLASKENLAEIFDQTSSDEVVRRFLAAVEAKLVARLEST